MKPLINVSARQALLFAFFLVSYEFLTYIANDLIMPGMIRVVETFHASELNIAASMSLYTLGGGSLQLFLGPISDRFGRRPVMLCGVILFVISTLLLAFTQSISQFLTIRFIEGMGLCFINVVGYTVLHEIFFSTDAVRLSALMTNVGVLAPLIGPVVGSILIECMHWRTIFASIALCSIFVYVGLLKFMPESIGQIRVDGTKIEATRLTWKIIYKNYKILFTNVQFLLSGVAYGILGIVFVAWIGLSPVIMISEAKLSMLTYGLWQIPIFSAFIIASFSLVYLTYIRSLKQVVRYGAIISFLGLMFMGIMPKLMGNSYIWLIPGMIIYSFGYGIIAAPYWRLILFSTNMSKGVVSGTMSMLYMLIQGIGIELGNLAYASHNNLYFGYYAMIIAVLFITLFFLYSQHLSFRQGANEAERIGNTAENSSAKSITTLRAVSNQDL